MKDFVVTQKNKGSSKGRESGIELLRVLSIFFVVVIHQVTAFLDSGDLFVVILRIISWPAIFSFAFITGYYLILKKDNEKKVKPFLWLTLEIVIWRVVIALIFLLCLTFIEHYSVEQFFGKFFGDIILTLVDVKSWYFWAIIFIYLVFPFFADYLNRNYKTGKKLLKGILIFLVITSIVATLDFFLSDILGYNFTNYTNPYTIITVLLASVLGAYWHLVEQEKRIQYDWIIQLIGLLSLIIIYLINFSCIWWADKNDAVLSYLNIFWYLSGWCYFLIFKGFNFHSKFVNYWAGLSWWIYILHNGVYLPRGWAPRIITSANIDPYSQTVATIFLCYFLGIILSLATKNFDKFVVKPFIIDKIKIDLKKKKEKKLQNKKAPVSA